MDILSIKGNDNCLTTASRLFSLLSLEVTEATLRDQLLSHPDYPSLLSISDVLSSYHAKNIAAKTTIDKLVELPTPFVASITERTTKNHLFVIVESVQDNSIELFDTKRNKVTKVNFEDFEKIWNSGIVLIVDAADAVGEKNYKQKCRRENRIKLFNSSLLMAAPVLILALCILAYWSFGDGLLPWITHFLLSLIGCGITILLLWYEVDEDAPVLQQICSATKKYNCGAILNSSGSKIWGISWSEIGFTYFTGGLILFIFMGILNREVLFTVSWFNIFALPYVVFSLYYQSRIAKQWCILCLCVQALLVLQFLISFVGGWESMSTFYKAINWYFSIPIITAYLIPFLFIRIIFSVLRVAKESQDNKLSILRLKHNPEIFESLLVKQKKIQESPEGLGITLGNPNASWRIVKVCNPYCAPCAQAHVFLEELLENNPDISLQIIFTATNDESDRRALPVKHLLALAEETNSNLPKALDDWYTADQKSYQVFADKYPLQSSIIDRQGKKVNEMKDWCNKIGISYTPTVFVNGYQLPGLYSISDLKYFLLT